MFRSRIAAAAALTVGACGIALGSAGTAAAVEPLVGEGYAGVYLNPADTQFLADSNASAVLDDVVPPEESFVWMGYDSTYDDGSGRVAAGYDQLVDEAAARGGTVSFWVTDPAIYGYRYQFLQDW